MFRRCNTCVGDGVPLLELRIPARYTHGPIEMEMLADTQTAILAEDRDHLRGPVEIHLISHCRAG